MIPLDGFLFLLILVSLGLASVVWAAFWVPRRFRVIDRDADGIRRRWSIGGALLVALLLAFPPMHRAGEWREAANGREASEPEVVDRAYFGLAPSFGWIGRVGSEVAADHELRCGDYGCTRYRWGVDRATLIGEMALAVFFLLPFLRATRPERRDRSEEGGG